MGDVLGHGLALSSKIHYCSALMRMWAFSSIAAHLLEVSMTWARMASFVSSSAQVCRLVQHEEHDLLLIRWRLPLVSVLLLLFCLPPRILLVLVADAKVEVVVVQSWRAQARLCGWWWDTVAYNLVGGWQEA
jgi:hypothetical protein